MYKTKATLFAWLFLFTILVIGQPPKYVVPDQKILGDDRPINAGKLVKLGISPVNEPVEHLVSSAYKWKVYDYDTKNRELVELDDVMEGNEPGTIFFGAGIESKKLHASCFITHVYFIKDKDAIKEVGTRTKIVSATVIIGDPNPGPGPGPGPGPNPNPDDPVFPDGTYKLSAAAYKAAMSKVTNADARAKGAAALHKSFKGLASSIAAGAFPTLKAALVQSKVANNQALKDAGVALSDWDGFGVALEDVVYDLYASKKIGTAADLGTAWLEVAAGLEKVK
jgi:hypothetical protein